MTTSIFVNYEYTFVYYYVIITWRIFETLPERTPIMIMKRPDRKSVF